MEEAVMYGVAVALLMLGVPLWHSMGECRKGRLVRVHLCRWWLLCGFMVMVSLMIAVVFGVAGFVLENSAPPKAPRLSAECRILAKSMLLKINYATSAFSLLCQRNLRECRHEKSIRSFWCHAECDCLV